MNKTETIINPDNIVTAIVQVSITGNPEQDLKYVLLLLDALNRRNTGNYFF